MSQGIVLLYFAQTPRSIPSIKVQPTVDLSHTLAHFEKFEPWVMFPIAFVAQDDLTDYRRIYHACKEHSEEEDLCSTSISFVKGLLEDCPDPTAAKYTLSLCMLPRCVHQCKLLFWCLWKHPTGYHLDVRCFPQDESFTLVAFSLVDAEKTTTWSEGDFLQVLQEFQTFQVGRSWNDIIQRFFTLDDEFDLVQYLHNARHALC